MKALLLVEKSKLEMVDLPSPAVGADDLLVRIRACGICGSDVHGYDGSSGRRIPPIVMGHEAAGVIERVGNNVAGFAVGDRITFDSTVYCGQCWFCRSGRFNLCDRRQVLGVSCADYRRNGCFAEFASVPQHIACKLPEQLSFEQAAMVEAVSIAVHAVGRVPRVMGYSVLVVGAGMIGQLLVQVLRAAGCGNLIVTDVDDTRLAQAKSSGADQTVNGTAANVVDQIIACNAGRGVDLAFEAVGVAASIGNAIASVRKGGSVVLVGNVSPTVPLPLQSVVTREISLLGSCASSGEYLICLDLIARGKVDVAPLISAVAPLDEGPSWFRRLHERELGLMKVILQP